MRTAFISLGANLGPTRQNINHAISRLRHLAASENSQNTRFRVSPLYRTQAQGMLGPDSAPDYINAVIAFECSLSAGSLLRELHAIEAELGRERSVPNAPRTMDLDLLMLGQEAVNTASLTLPHPRMMQRAFVLRPLADLEPELVIKGKSIQELIQAVSSQRCEIMSEGT